MQCATCGQKPAVKEWCCVDVCEDCFAVRMAASRRSHTMELMAND